MKKLLIAIDPGRTGAIASVGNPTTDPIFDLIKMPDTVYDLRDELRDLVQDWQPEQVVCWLEKAQGGIFGTKRLDVEAEFNTWVDDNMITMHPSSVYLAYTAGAEAANRNRPSASRTFKYGQGYGQLVGLVVGLGIELHEHRPQDWMKKLGALPSGKAARKTAIHDKMQKIYQPQGVKVFKYAADAMGLLHVMIGEHQPEVTF